MLSGLNIPNWAQQLSLMNSLLLLIGGGALLVLAGFLLGFRRKQRVVLQRSLLTDEMNIYLGRIAEALERIASRPSSEHLLEQIAARLPAQPAEGAEKNASGSRSIPYSMLGREY